MSQNENSREYSVKFGEFNVFGDGRDRTAVREERFRVLVADKRSPDLRKPEDGLHDFFFIPLKRINPDSPGKPRFVCAVYWGEGRGGKEAAGKRARRATKTGDFFVSPQPTTQLYEVYPAVAAVRGNEFRLVFANRPPEEGPWWDFPKMRIFQILEESGKKGKPHKTGLDPEKIQDGQEVFVIPYSGDNPEKGYEVVAFSTEGEAIATALRRERRSYWHSNGSLVTVGGEIARQLTAAEVAT